KNSYGDPLKDEHPLVSQDDLEIDEIESLVREVEAMEWEEVQALSSREVSASAHSSQRAPSPFLPSPPVLAGTRPPTEVPPASTAINIGEEPKAKPPKANEPVAQPVPPPSKPPVALNINWKWWLVLSLLTLLLLFLVGGSFYYH